MGARLSALVTTLSACSVLAFTAPVLAQQPPPAAGADTGTSASTIGSAAKAGAAQAYHGTVNEIEDGALTAKVKSALLSDPTTQSSTIHVSSESGIVTLKGTVPNIDVARHAQDIVQGVSGVKLVRNDLQPAAMPR